MNSRIRFVAIAVVLISLAACATTPSGRTRRAVERYLRATTLEQASALLAPNYEARFEDTGSTLDRAAAVESLEWDFALNPYRRIDGISVDGDTVTVRVHEENDFSRVIGFPGWDATATFVVDANGLITSQRYQPDPSDSDYRTYLEPALAWLRENRPEALARIYPGGKMSRTAAAAREWVTVLRAWRQATAR